MRSACAAPHLHGNGAIVHQHYEGTEDFVFWRAGITLMLCPLLINEGAGVELHNKSELDVMTCRTTLSSHRTAWPGWELTGRSALEQPGSRGQTQPPVLGAFKAALQDRHYCNEPPSCQNKTQCCPDVERSLNSRPRARRPERQHLRFCRSQYSFM